MAIDQAIKKLNKLSKYWNTQTGIAKLAIKIGNEIVSRTPIDTGAARSNWYISINNPNTIFDKNKTDGNLSGLDLHQLSTRSFRQIYITNNAPYIVRLNEGHSVQAPAGFIEAGIIRGIDKFTEIIQQDMNKINRGR